MWSMTRRLHCIRGKLSCQRGLHPEILLADSNDELLEDTELTG